MLIEQIIEFELRGSGPLGRTCTPTTGYFQCWAPQDFFLVRVSKLISIFLICNRKSAIARLKG